MNPDGPLPDNYPFNRPFWSSGLFRNPVQNAYEHLGFQHHPEVFELKPGDPRYVQKVHEFLDHIERFQSLPANIGLKIDKWGTKRYVIDSDNGSPYIVIIQEAKGALVQCFIVQRVLLSSILRASPV